MKGSGLMNIQKAIGWLMIAVGIGFLAVPIAETPPLAHHFVVQITIAVVVPFLMLTAVVLYGRSMIRWILSVPALYFAGSMVVWYYLERPDGGFFTILLLVAVILTVFLLLSGLLIFGGWELSHPKSRNLLQSE